MNTYTNHIAVITANMGNFDKPLPFARQDILFDRFYFTDAGGHHTLPHHYPMHTQDSRMKAKYYKMLAHQVLPHDILIWIDANVEIKQKDFISTIVHQLGDADVCISRHPHRNNVFQEADFITDQLEKKSRGMQNRYSSYSINKEVEGYNRHWDGLFWCGLFARRNNLKINTAFEHWFMENVLWTNFDQNNFIKIMHRHQLKIAEGENWGYENCEALQVHPHKKKGMIKKLQQLPTVLNKWYKS